MDFKTNYPYVFVHGIFGYGPGSKIQEYTPYFGCSGGSITEYFNDNGMEAYEAAVGPFSSAWDRACELYAQLTGTRVDYGKAHSEFFGHERFGRTYTRPLFEGWGTADASGVMKKINLIGHSFGGTTARVLTTLLAYGCHVERENTDASDISPLFTGGKSDWVHSVTTYATPHNGMTLFTALGTMENSFRRLIYKTANLINNTPLPKLYDFKLDQFGLTTDPYSTVKAAKNKQAAEALADSEDNIFYDLSIEGAEVINSRVHCVPGVYYFSYTGSRTKKGMMGNSHRPNRNMFLPLKLTSLLIGAYKKDDSRGIDLDSDWLENDGIVNTYSCTSPFTEPTTDFNITDNIRPGMWYKMGVMDMDHLNFRGHKIPHAEICALYYAHAAGINRL